MMRALLVTLALSFCLPTQVEGKIIFLMFTDSGHIMQVPYRQYLTDEQNVRSWEKMLSGPVRVWVAPASQGLPEC